MLRTAFLILVLTTRLSTIASAQIPLPNWLDFATINPGTEMLTTDSASMTFGGEWGNGCPPNVSAHSIENTALITLEVEYPITPCPDVHTDWSLDESFGQLPEGNYVVFAELYSRVALTNERMLESPSQLVAVFSVVPEPQSLTLLLASLGLLFGRVRRAKLISQHDQDCSV
ncbi:MAG: PEP-CTERM sorting domain-containing protein [Planctomycetota bacterium]